jgi:hypothetical protein
MKRDPALLAEDGMTILARLVANWTVQANECRAMAERLGDRSTIVREILRDAAQYEQSIYGVGLAISALRQSNSEVKP